MQQESNSFSGNGMINMEQFSSPAQIRSAVANLINPPSYSSIFYQSARSAAPATPPASSNSHSVTGGGIATSFSAAAIGSLSRLMSEHEELQSLHAHCVAKLQRAFKESETLRQENTNLRVANHDLNLLIEAALQSQYSKAMFPDASDQYMPMSSLSERFGGLSIGEKKRESGALDEGFSNESPTSVIENNRSECQNVEAGRVTLPKSISVRSNAFLKMSQAAACASGSNSGFGRGTARIRAQNPVRGPQKVYVRGGSRKDGPIELEVYNQGMFKTELCNKWQESGTCPYGDHCQFAHGVAELRPVIRHPRYKTEVCRMVLAGDPCPYGHRCHFRHALTEQEKLMIPLRQPHHPPELG